MKKLRLLLIVMLAFTFSTSLFGQWTGDGSKATVIGSLHDLSRSGSGLTGATRVCEFCHTPHVLSAAAPTLLWNVSLPTGPFTTYSSSTFDALANIRDPSTAAPATQASYMTYLCLSCHDGAVAVPADFTSFTSLLGTGTLTTLPPDVTQGGLANDHPVDFLYDAALATADGGIQTPLGPTTANPYIDNGTDDLPLFKDDPTDGLDTGRLECATCHNPHKADTSNSDDDFFLRGSNLASALCITCHQP